MASLASSTIYSAHSINSKSSIYSKAVISRNTRKSASLNAFPLRVAIRESWEAPSTRLLFSYSKDRRFSFFPISAVGSGLEASITDQKTNDISLDNVKIVVESRDDDKIHVRVDLTGEETQKAFDDALANLARTAPPIPGFRRMKGGKTSKVPKSFLLQILGKDRVTKFLIQEIVSITIGDYVKKENLPAKSQVKTTETAEELESAFTPGEKFGFNATVELESPEPEEKTDLGE